MADLFETIEESAAFHAEAYRKFIHLRGVIDPDAIEIVDPSAFALKRTEKTSLLQHEHAFTAELYAQQVANRVNDLARILLGLKTWETILRDYDDQQQFYLRVEFVSPQLRLGIAEISGIKSQLAFSAAKVAIQLESFDSKREIPSDDQITITTWETWCQGWLGYEDFKKALRRLNPREFRDGTRQFRNRRAHTIAPSLFGIVPAHRVSWDGKEWKMEIRYEPPLEIAQVTDLLIRQHVVAVDAVKELRNFFRARFNPQ